MSKSKNLIDNLIGAGITETYINTILNAVKEEKETAHKAGQKIGKADLIGKLAKEFKTANNFNSSYLIEFLKRLA
tara:strand:+ start:16740 stop:16964 length:225 start_codon:yes stop_codon:yes gene_type:complete